MEANLSSGEMLENAGSLIFNFLWILGIISGMAYHILMTTNKKPFALGVMVVALGLFYVAGQGWTTQRFFSAYDKNLWFYTTILGLVWWGVGILFGRFIYGKFFA